MTMILRFNAFWGACSSRSLLTSAEFSHTLGPKKFSVSTWNGYARCCWIRRSMSIRGGAGP